MAKTLDIIEQQLNVGDVKTISNGNTIKYIELLFSPTTKVQFAPSDDNKSMRLSVSDNNLEMPELDCTITKEIIRRFILSLKEIYNQLDDESEVKAN